MSIPKEKWLIILSFGIVYFVWGSTYLANEYAIDFMPPRLMVGTRFVIAGLLLLFFTKSVDWKNISKRQILNAYLMGSLFMTLGVGSTVWAQQFVDSGIACLLGGIHPLLVVLFMWGLYNEKIKIKAIIGIILGFLGMILLVFQNEFTSEQSTLFGIGIILFATCCWSIGSVLIPKMDLPNSKNQSAAIQMLSGGGNLVVISLLQGEWTAINFTDIPLISWLAWAYLIIFGSIAAFSAFNYLLLKVNPSKVATTAYVNPIIAVFLGWWFRDELITGQTIIAACIMILAVFFINSSKVSKNS